MISLRHRRKEILGEIHSRMQRPVLFCGEHHTTHTGGQRSSEADERDVELCDGQRSVYGAAFDVRPGGWGARVGRGAPVGERGHGEGPRMELGADLQQRRLLRRLVDHFACAHSGKGFRV